MTKRIALFVLGLALMLGAFLLYQYVAGPDALGGKKPKAVVKAVPTTLPMTVESRNDKGELEYVITATSAPTSIRDAAGNVLPGQFTLDKPLATFYDKSGRVIQISADTCTAVIENGPKGGSGGLGGVTSAGGGKLADTLTVREGKLLGHVRMTINPQAVGAAATGSEAKVSGDPLAGGLRVYFDEELHLDGIQEVLTTKGGVHVRSQTLGFDGQGLQLVFNRKARRVDYLGIDYGNQVVIRGVGARALSLAEPATRPGAAAASAPASAPAGTPPTSYRLSFGQDVRAAVGESTLASEHLYVIFMAQRDLLGEPATAAAPAAGPAATLAALPTILQIPETPEAVAPPTKDDLVVKWAGPMEIRPADDKDLKLADGRDVALEAVGTALKPVTVTDPRFGAQAGRLWYHGAEQRIVLEPEDFKKVLLTDPSRGSTDPSRGSVECLAVSIDQKANRAVLTGPGILISKANGGETTATWKTRLDLDLESTPDLKDSKKMLVAIRHAVLYGAGIKADTFDLQSDVLDAVIANVLENGKQTLALEHLLVTGNVLVNSYRKGAIAGEQGGMQTQRMEILTAKTASGGAGSQVPVPSELRAEGDVVAWRFTDKSKSLGAGLTGADAGKGLQKETITTPKLIASLAPKAKAAGPASAPAAASDNSFAGAGQSFDVTHFVASGGAKVEIAPPPVDIKNRTIVAIAGTIDAFPDLGTATLTASDGGPDVQIAIGGDTVQGRNVFLDRDAKTFKIAGAGVFYFILPSDKTRKTATPMIVTWQDAMTYDDIKHLAIFTGKPVARMLAAPGVPDQSDQASLVCEQKLTVQLKAPVVPTPSSAGTVVPTPSSAGVAVSSSPTTIAGTSLALDWIQADGKVEAFGAQVGPDNKPLTRLRLSVTDSAGSLRYNDSNRAFDVYGPGALVVDNFRPDKPGERVSSSGESDFAWQGGLKYDGAAGKITFTRNVDFFFKPTKPFNFGNSLAAGAASAPATGPRPPDIAHLHTDQLVATLVQAKDASGRTIDSPIGLGTGGNQDLSKVDATGGPVFEVGIYRLAGDAMTFDVPTNIAIMSGTADEPAVATRLGGQRIMGKRFKMDLTKDKNFFEVEGLQGNLSGFGE